MLQSIDRHDFTIGRFMELSHSLGCTLLLASSSYRSPLTSLAGSQPSAAALGKSSTNLPGIAPSDALPAPVPSSSLPAIHASLNARLAALHADLPPLTALIVFTGHGDPQEMARLAAKKAKFDRLWKTVKQSEIVGDDRWMEEDDRRLLDEVERCRAGLSFYCIK